MGHCDLLLLERRPLELTLKSLSRCHAMRKMLNGRRVITGEFCLVLVIHVSITHQSRWY